MIKLRDLLNVWTILATIMFGLAVISHSFISIMLTCFGFLFLSIALYFELEKYEFNKVKYVSYPLGLICMAYASVQLYIGENKVVPQYITKYDTLIVRFDTSQILKTQPEQLIATIKPLAKSKKKDEKRWKSKNIEPQKSTPETKPEQSNPQQYQPPTIENITFSVEKINSDKPTLPYLVKVIIQTNIKIEKPHFQVLCTTPIEDGDFFFSGGGVMMMTRAGTGSNGAGLYGLDFSCEFPTFTPEVPMIARLYAKQPINVIKVIHIPS